MMIYFPFLVLSVIAFGVAVGSYYKFPDSYILSNALALCSPIYFFTIALLAVFALYSEEEQLTFIKGRSLAETKVNYKYPFVFMAIGFGLAICVICNMIYTTLQSALPSIRKDEKLNEWKKQHPGANCIFKTLSFLLSFDISRFYYSKFYGLSSFSGELTNWGSFIGLLNVFSLIRIIFCFIPVLIVCLWALSVYYWGTQFYILLIEALILSVLMLLLSCIEFRVRQKQPRVQDENDYSKIKELSELFGKTMQDQKDWMERQRRSELEFARESKLSKRSQRRKQSVEEEEEDYYDELEGPVDSLENSGAKLISP